MALIKCNECGNLVSDKASTCPHCGVDMKEQEERVCPICHKSYPAGTIFCSADGAKLVSPSKMTPTCVICGTQYPDGNTKYCPKDGGAVIPEALRNTTGSYARQDNANHQKANIGNRFLASLLDGLISTGLAIPAIIFYVIGVANSGYSDAIPFFIIAGFMYLIPMAYCCIKDGLGNGQSYGKKALKIKVIRVADSSKCTIGTSALRCLIGSLINFIPFVGWLVEPIMVLATADGRRLADKVAGTMVVNA